MKSRPENVEPARVLGYLGSDKVLYCSPACAAERGQATASPVDEDQYAALADAGALDPAAVVCPVCGSEYPFELPVGDEAP
jgi:hypothetical protein